jgi:hypothetical protein
MRYLDRTDRDGLAYNVKATLYLLLRDRPGKGGDKFAGGLASR